MAPTYVFIASALIISSAFQGIGRGMPGLVIAVFRSFALSVPGAYLLSMYYSTSGIWYAIAISNLIVGLLSIVWFYLWSRKHDQAQKQAV